VKPVVHP
jgi:inhibitor of KinA sporulation pathway (predicted exonuclease)